MTSNRQSSMNDPSKPSLLQVFKSVLASFFGVQSEKNRQRDFIAGSPVQFIVMGLIATLFFILGVWGVVTLILKLAAPG